VGVRRMCDRVQSRAAGYRNLVNYDDIIDALQSLDAGQSADTVTYAFKPRQRRRRRSEWKSRGRGSSLRRPSFPEAIDFRPAKSMSCVTAVAPCLRLSRLQRDGWSRDRRLR